MAPAGGIHCRCNASLRGGVFFPANVFRKHAHPLGRGRSPTTGSHSSWLTYHMFSKLRTPRTRDLFVTRRSRSLAIRSNATQKECPKCVFRFFFFLFFFSLRPLFSLCFSLNHHTPVSLPSTLSRNARADHSRANFANSIDRFESILRLSADEN